jgi:hypothetical protein
MASTLRRSVRSETYPENSLTTFAVASPTPSKRPTINGLAPRMTTRNTGISPWIISDEMSTKRLTNPSAQMLLGMRGMRTP